MMVHKQIWPVLLSVAAVTAQTAIVTIEASHGGAASGLMNTTIEVPLNTRYLSSALTTVSTLYLTGAEGVSLASISCTPYRNGNLTGSGGLPFTSSTPSRLSTNTVQVGSLVCNSAESNTAVTSNLTTTTSTTSARNATSKLLTTVGPSSPTAGPLTITSFATFEGQNGPSTSTYTSVVDGQASQTSTGSPSLSSEGAAAKTQIGGWLAKGVAMAGVGLAMVV